MLGALRRLAALGLVALLLTVGCASFAQYSRQAQTYAALTDAAAAALVLDDALAAHIDSLPGDLNDRTYDAAAQAVQDLEIGRAKWREARGLYLADEPRLAAGRLRAALFELEAVLLYLEQYPERQVAARQARRAIERAYAAVDYVLGERVP